jgi:pyridoxamine 5'-phosphate oxidase
MNLADARRDFAGPPLRRADLAADPIAQIARWLDDAIAADEVEPTAVTLATADAAGRPSARVVLLKGFDHAGFVFFTSYLSRKADDLEVNPWAALSFYWGSFPRAVRVEGRVARVSRAESEAYFARRPRGSRIAAHAAHQSRTVADRAALERAVRDAAARFAGVEVPCPESWGGYRLVPGRVEVWQGRPDRVHDRFLYTAEPGGAWTVERLAP